LAGRMNDVPGLTLKLQDLTTLLEEYLAWLDLHRLQDRDSLLSRAAEALTDSPGTIGTKVDRHGAQLDLFARSHRRPRFLFERLWVDGFAHLSEQEMELLAALAPYGREGTIMFCLDRTLREEVSWLSTWSVVGKTFADCRKRLGRVSGLEIVTETLDR